MQDEGHGNGELKPCWIAHDCQLAQDQRSGNDLLAKILAQLETMNTSLVAPATNANRVPTCVLAWVIAAFVVLLVVQKVIDSGYEASGSAAGGHVTVTHAEKKTERHEGESGSY